MKNNLNCCKLMKYPVDTLSLWNHLWTPVKYPVDRCTLYCRLWTRFVTPARR